MKMAELQREIVQKTSPDTLEHMIRGKRASDKDAAPGEVTAYSLIQGGDVDLPGISPLGGIFASVRGAQKIFANYTQEQVDKIFLAAASAANSSRIPLAKMAVSETGMGIVEDKVIKNHFAAEYVYNAYKDTKTCGLIEEDKAFGIRKIAEPLGVVAAVIPTTNPTSTTIFKVLLALKTRNGIVISPHPRAKRSTIEAARILRDAAVAAGAPEG
ncbi:MAG: aldehyde dehydrogenase family protein, partial [Synergistaceae bacterium]|nr:aldehyde dehydrogenase family protein [Synergistaceae bacterium]